MRLTIFVLVFLLGIVSVLIAGDDYGEGTGDGDWGMKSGVVLHSGQDAAVIRDLLIRVTRLEKAVRDLHQECGQHNQVGVIVEPSTYGKWTCMVQGQSFKKFFGQGITRGEAESKAIEKCQRQESAIFCNLRECKEN